MDGTPFSLTHIEIRLALLPSLLFAVLPQCMMRWSVSIVLESDRQD